MDTPTLGNYLAISSRAVYIYLSIYISLTQHFDSLVNTPQKCIHSFTCTRIFIEVLLIIVPKWKQPKYPFIQWSNIPH